MNLDLSFYNWELFTSYIQKGLMKDGTLTKLWDKWFLQPIPPKNARVGLALSESTKQAWANPNDKPAEDYQKK